MVQRSLTEYIQKLLRTGYDVGTIRTTLINAGYSPYEVNQALKYVRTEPKRKITLNLKVVLIGVSILILLILLVLGGIKIFSPKEKTIDYKILPIKTELYQGEMLSFLNELTSNIDRKEQVSLNYEILNTRTNEVVLTKQDFATAGRHASTTAKIVLPAGIPEGSFMLKATMQHDNKAEQQSFKFTVLKMPEKGAIAEIITEETPAEVECPESCDDFNPCTEDSCENGICRHAPILPCCGNGICEEGETVVNCPEDCAKQKLTPQELISQAKDAATVAPEAAAMLCNKLIKQNDIDLCFSEVAQASKKSIICENVKIADNKDNCYMAFALEDDYSVCAKIKNSYLSKSCYSLKRSSMALAQARGIAEEYNATSV